MRGTSNLGAGGEGAKAGENVRKAEIGLGRLCMLVFPDLFLSAEKASGLTGACLDCGIGSVVAGAIGVGLDTSAGALDDEDTGANPDVSADGACTVGTAAGAFLGLVPGTAFA